MTLDAILTYISTDAFEDRRVETLRNRLRNMLANLRRDGRFDEGISGPASQSSLGAPCSSSASAVSGMVPGTGDVGMGPVLRADAARPSGTAGTGEGPASAGDGMPSECARSSAVLSNINSPSLSLRRCLGPVSPPVSLLLRTQAECAMAGDEVAKVCDVRRSRTPAAGPGADSGIGVTVAVAVASPETTPECLRASSCCKNPSNDRPEAGRLSTAAVPLRRRWCTPLRRLGLRRNCDSDPDDAPATRESGRSSDDRRRGVIGDRVSQPESAPDPAEASDGSRSRGSKRNAGPRSGCKPGCWWDGRLDGRSEKLSPCRLALRGGPRGGTWGYNARPLARRAPTCPHRGDALPPGAFRSC